MSGPSPTLFNRFILPGFAFKAVVIGGGYATGRELAEFFLPSGPRGGLLGMGLAMCLWSGVCALTFLLARATGSHEYRTFFGRLLGPAWVLFDIAYVCQLIVVLAVFAAAAGAIASTTFGLPTAVGTLALIGGIATVTAFGTTSVERLFKYVTYFLYAVYAIFLCLALSRWSDLISIHFGDHTASSAGWIAGGVTYASYNLVGAVVILPVLRHLTSNRDAVIAGLLCGPLAMLPAALFFLSMIAFYPQIAGEALPSDFMLARLNIPLLRVVFQLMIFCALLESGTGMVHAINERIGTVYASHHWSFTARTRFAISATLLSFVVFVAARFGLVALIASGYRAVAFALLAVFIMPLLTYGVWLLYTGRATSRSPLTAG